MGSNKGRARLHNQQVVLQQIRMNQPIGRAQIARDANLSTQTVSNIIAELCREGWLQEAGKRSKGPGLPVVLYALKPKGAVALGIEIQPRGIFITLVDLVGQPLFSQRVELADCRPENVLPLVQQLMRDAMSETGTEAKRLLGAGVVMPGPFGRVGLSDAGQSLLAGWNNIDPADMFSSALDIPVVIENDAISAAVGERVHGVAKNLSTYAYVYFGTGIGLGVVANGQVLRGAFGNAGELGHVVVQPGGNHCVCGNSGCLETYVSRLALAKKMAEAGYTINSCDDLQALFIASNPVLLAWLDQASIPLSQAIGMVENLFDPETVVVGGAMPDQLLDYLIKHLRLPSGSIAQRANRKRPRVIRGACGRMTATLGGAALVFNEVFTPRAVSEPRIARYIEEVVGADD